MTDIIGDHTFWPPYIRAIFWQKDIGYHNRFKVVAFAAVNGLPIKILKEWLSTYQCVYQADAKGWDHINWLISECYFGTHYRDTWFAFNVHNRMLQYLNGNRVGPVTVSAKTTAVTIMVDDSDSDYETPDTE